MATCKRHIDLKSAAGTFTNTRWNSGERLATVCIRRKPLQVLEITAALNEYLAALECGAAPDRDEFLSHFPEVQDELRACLEGLEFIHLAGQHVVDESSEGTPFRPVLEPGLGQPGDFRLLREWGRGGMGVVYEAEQVSLGRRVALRVLTFAAMLDPTRLQRFHLEAHAAASLDHPHIVPVFVVGQDRGVHFYAMRLIEGHSLAEIIALSRHGQAAIADMGSPSTPSVRPDADTQPVAAVTTLTTQRSHDAPTFFRSVAKLGIQAAEALEHAHRVGMIHRDVKPSNLPRYGYWGPIVEQSVAAFLKCGDLQEGFARVRCPDCKHEMFVAFSCKQRCTCPSCHQKRTLLTALHVAEEVCSRVAHRQVVLTIPKRLRVHTRFDRQLLGKLSSCAWTCLKVLRLVLKQVARHAEEGGGGSIRPVVR